MIPFAGFMHAAQDDGATRSTSFRWSWCFGSVAAVTPRSTAFPIRPVESQLRPQLVRRGAVSDAACHTRMVGSET